MIQRPAFRAAMRRSLCRGSQFFIEDLGSANGTFINGQLRLTPKKPHVLVSGDEVKLGETTLKFVVS